VQVQRGQNNTTFIEEEDMANELDLILHRIRIRLYPNYLPKTAGAYIARTNNQKTLSIEEVCSIMKTRGGFAGDYGDLVKCV
jgi:hypothetical protein